MSATIAAAAIRRNMSGFLLCTDGSKAERAVHCRYSVRLQRALVLQPRPQALEQPLHRLTTVADAIFFLHAQFGSCAPDGGDEKQRIVTEPAAAAGRAQNLAVPFTFSDDRLRILWRTEQYSDAVVVRAAALAGGKQLQQAVVVALIRLRLTGEARG